MNRLPVIILTMYAVLVIILVALNNVRTTISFFFPIYLFEPFIVTPLAAYLTTFLNPKKIKYIKNSIPRNSTLFLLILAGVLVLQFPSEHRGGGVLAFTLFVILFLPIRYVLFKHGIELSVNRLKEKD
jgi:hypothetical protein